MIGTSAIGQEKPYPTKSITYLVTFDPGGQSDREARRQQPLLEKILGQKVIVDYKVGGGGALGWSELVRSQPDGYLMAGINIPHIILQPMQQATGYKTDQIVPVALFQRTPLALAVLKTSPYTTRQGLHGGGQGQVRRHQHRRVRDVLRVTTWPPCGCRRWPARNSTTCPSPARRRRSRPSWAAMSTPSSATPTIW